MEKEFDSRTWAVDPFPLLLAEAIAITRLANAELAGDKEKIKDATAAWMELNS